MSSDALDHAAGPAVDSPPARPGHGSMFTSHMITAAWDEDGGWTPLEFGPLENLALHPGTIGLHYAQVVFEGLKAHRAEDGSVSAFRPADHARRFQHSAARLAMPELPVEVFLQAIDKLVAADEGWLSDDPALSLYLRPFMFGSDAHLMLRPSERYRFVLIAFVAGGFFGDDVEAIDVWVTHDHHRAFPTGTGNVKVSGNYAPTYLAQQRALEHGCQQALYLDSTEGRWIEELGGTSVFLVRGGEDPIEVITPELSGTVLPSVTRDSLLSLARRLGYMPVEARVSLDQWREESQSGRVTEAFSCGTAAVVTPIRAVRDEGGDWVIGNGEPGPVSMALRQELIGIHHGRVPDTEGWLRPVVGPRGAG